MKKIFRWNLLEIVIIGAILLLAGVAGAANQINSCTTIDSPGEYVLNQSIMNSRASKMVIAMEYAIHPIDLMKIISTTCRLYIKLNLSGFW